MTDPVKEPRTSLTMEMPKEGYDKLIQKLLDRDPEFAAFLAESKIMEVGPWKLNEKGYIKGPCIRLVGPSPDNPDNELTRRTYVQNLDKSTVAEVLLIVNRMLANGNIAAVFRIEDYSC